MDYTPAGMASEESGLSADEVLAEAAQRLLGAQISASDGIDGRTATAFGVGSTVLPVTIGLLNLLQTSLPLSTKTLLLGALLAYAVQIACASVVFLSRKRELDLDPNVETLQIYTSSYSGIQLRRWVADEVVRAIAYNRTVIRWKGRWSLAVIASLYVEAALLSLSAFFTIV